MAINQTKEYLDQLLHSKFIFRTLQPDLLACTFVRLDAFNFGATIAEIDLAIEKAIKYLEQELEVKHIECKTCGRPAVLSLQEVLPHGWNEGPQCVMCTNTNKEV